MRSAVAYFLVAFLAMTAEAFAPSSSSSARLASTQVYQYIPDGFTAASWTSWIQIAILPIFSRSLGTGGSRALVARPECQATYFKG
mgnify:CR=1 FL=1